MCILLLTTSHPDYALILLDNRDEFILRPTSRPTWWAHPAGHDVLSARDLQRAEKGTWMGMTAHGGVAVLTNYSEPPVADPAHPIHAIRSRGGMVTYWLGAPEEQSAEETLKKLVEAGVRSVGGFSMLCGKLRRQGKGIAPLAIVSNRSEHAGDVHWVAGSRGEVAALSNAVYGDADEWPKLQAGKALLSEAVRTAVEEGLDEEGLTERLFGVLDTDTLPLKPDASLTDAVPVLRQSIFIPPIGDESHRREMEEHRARGKTGWPAADSTPVETEGSAADKAVDSMGFATGMYGTQRQTVVLVDWEGNVTYRERALFDANGNKVERGEGDQVLRFKVEGWEDGKSQ